MSLLGRYVWVGFPRFLVGRVSYILRAEGRFVPSFSNDTSSVYDVEWHTPESRADYNKTCATISTMFAKVFGLLIGRVTTLIAVECPDFVSAPSWMKHDVTKEHSIVLVPAGLAFKDDSLTDADLSTWPEHDQPMVGVKGGRCYAKSAWLSQPVEARIFAVMQRYSSYIVEMKQGGVLERVCCLYCDVWLIFGDYRCPRQMFFWRRKMTMKMVAEGVWARRLVYWTMNRHYRCYR